MTETRTAERTVVVPALARPEDVERLEPTYSPVRLRPPRLASEALGPVRRTVGWLELGR